MSAGKSPHHGLAAALGAACSEPTSKRACWPRTPPKAPSRCASRRTPSICCSRGSTRNCSGRKSKVVIGTVQSAGWAGKASPPPFQIYFAPFPGFWPLGERSEYRKIYAVSSHFVLDSIGEWSYIFRYSQFVRPARKPSAGRFHIRRDLSRKSRRSRPIDKDKRMSRRSLARAETRVPVRVLPSARTAIRTTLDILADITLLLANDEAFEVPGDIAATLQAKGHVAIVDGAGTDGSAAANVGATRPSVEAPAVTPSAGPKRPCPNDPHRARATARPCAAGLAKRLPGVERRHAGARVRSHHV